MKRVYLHYKSKEFIIIYIRAHTNKMSVHYSYSITNMIIFFFQIDMNIHIKIYI